jgi:hypothetical protein
MFGTSVAAADDPSAGTRSCIRALAAGSCASIAPPCVRELERSPMAARRELLGENRVYAGDDEGSDSVA